MLTAEPVEEAPLPVAPIELVARLRAAWALAEFVDADWFELLKDATEDEEDMLDLAFGLTQTSRLGCQIIMTEELDGLTVRLPQATRNMMNV